MTREKYYWFRFRTHIEGGERQTEDLAHSDFIAHTKILRSSWDFHFWMCTMLRHSDRWRHTPASSPDDFP